MSENAPQDQAGDDAGQPGSSQGAERAQAVEESQQDQSGPQETSEQRIEALESELEAANRRVLIAQADVENFRKRVRRDYEEQIRYAAVPLIRDMLEVRDNLHRALDSVQSSDQSSDQVAGLREGVAMVAKQLEDMFQKHHCRAIPAEGELFDPNYHEAISQMPSDAHPAGTVVHEATRGYQLYDRVVRPSQVIVSTGPAQ